MKRQNLALSLQLSIVPVLVAHYCSFPKHITSNTSLKLTAIRNTKQFQDSKGFGQEPKVDLISVRAAATALLLSVSRMVLLTASGQQSTEHCSILRAVIGTYFFPVAIQRSLPPGHYLPDLHSVAPCDSEPGDNTKIVLEHTLSKLSKIIHIRSEQPLNYSHPTKTLQSPNSFS